MAKTPPTEKGKTAAAERAARQAAFDTNKVPGGVAAGAPKPPPPAPPALNVPGSEAAAAAVDPVPTDFESRIARAKALSSRPTASPVDTKIPPVGREAGFNRGAAKGKGGGAKLTLTSEGIGPVDPAFEEAQAHNKDQLFKLRWGQMMIAGVEANMNAADLNRLQLETEGDPDRVKEIYDDGINKSKAVFAAVEALSDSLANDRVDPNRFFSSRSAATGFASALAVAVGQMISVRTGTPNGAMRTMENAINRDLRAQEIEAFNKRSANNVSLQLIDRARAITSDQASAIDIVRHLRWQQVATKFQVRAAQLAQGRAKAQLEEAYLMANQQAIDAAISAQRNVLRGTWTGPHRKVIKAAAEDIPQISGTGARRTGAKPRRTGTKGAGTISGSAVSGGKGGGATGVSPEEVKQAAASGATVGPPGFPEEPSMDNLVDIDGEVYYVHPQSDLRDADGKIDRKAARRFREGALGLFEVQEKAVEYLEAMLELGSLDNKFIGTITGDEAKAKVEAIGRQLQTLAIPVFKVLTADERMTDTDVDNSNALVNMPGTIAAARAWLLPQDIFDTVEPTAAGIEAYIKFIGERRDAVFNGAQVLRQDGSPVGK